MSKVGHQVYLITPADVQALAAEIFAPEDILRMVQQ